MTFSAEKPIYETPVILKGRHDLANHPMFSDEAIARYFDNPKSKVVVNVMGEDPTQTSDWAYCDRAGATGQDLLQAVSNGRLWCNVVRAHQTEPDFAMVASEFEKDSSSNGKELQNIRTNLLVSSEGAQVYFHSDPEWNVLIQLRGKKRIYLYPPDLEEIAPRAGVEAIYSGHEEDLAYLPEFDEYATPVDLEPGEFVVWPLNGPHRVENTGGLSVSIAMTYETAWSHRRQSVGYANEYFRRTWGVSKMRSTPPGLRAFVKLALYKVLSKIRKPVVNQEIKENSPRFRLDESAALGYSPLDLGNAYQSVA